MTQFQLLLITIVLLSNTFIGFELDEMYFNIAKERLQNYDTH